MIARSRADFDAAFDLTSTSENARVIGSSVDEWMKGPNETRPLIRKQWEDMPTHESEILRLEAFENGNVGWAALEERRTYEDGWEEVVRMSLVLEITGGAWKIVQSHLSYPVPNRLPMTETIAELAQAVKADAVEGNTDRLSSTSTFMFTDVVGSTALSGEMGDAAWMDLIDTHLERSQDVVGQHNGSTVKTLGDGGMYAFEAASSALRAAQAIQTSLAEPTAPPIQVRIGVHTGDVVHADGDYFGLAVSKTARVASAAEGGQILVSDTTAGMVNPSDFSFGPVKGLELRGFGGTQYVRELRWRPADELV